MLTGEPPVLLSQKQKKEKREMKKMQILMLAAVMFSLNGFLSAGEKLDIKGSFGSELTGWHANKPGHWDDAGKVSMNKIPDTEKYALQVTSESKGMHLYGKQWTIATGDKCIIKGMVKGKGKGGFGVYTYPGGGMVSKEFQATDEWTEFIAELTIPTGNPEINKISVVIVVSPGASIEFSDVTAEVVKKQ
jgi:hypothetical protein